MTVTITNFKNPLLSYSVFAINDKNRAEKDGVERERQKNTLSCYLGFNCACKIYIQEETEVQIGRTGNIHNKHKGERRV